MAKIDLTVIAKGLQKVQDQAAAMETVAHDEMIDADLIYFAENNPYSESDTPEELEALAADIKVNGLIHPLVVHQDSPEHYTLISGEKRFKAINTLGWKRIPCRVYSGLSPDRAQLMLHSANLSARDYTAEQKLRFYVDADALLRRMQESGEYTGPLQKGLAALLNVSDRQIRRYKTITEKLTAEQKAEVASGGMSMRTALELISDARKESEEPISLPWDPADTCPLSEEKDSTDEPAAASESSSLPVLDVSQPSEEPEAVWAEPQPPAPKLLITWGDMENGGWRPWIEALIHSAYNCNMLYEYYITQVPTPQEAIEDFLCPPAPRRGTLHGEEGTYELEQGCAGIWNGDGKNVRLSYVIVDELVRRMIRNKDLLPDEERKAILLRL